MQIFEHTLARVAVWNLAGFGGINIDRMKRPAEGLALLDAELVTLVEVNPVSCIDALAAEIGTYGLHYDTTIIPQPGNLHIGFRHKKGVEVTNARLVPGSEGDYEGGRRAVSVDVQMGKFSAHLLGVHLKSGRDKPDQKLRDTLNDRRLTGATRCKISDNDDRDTRMGTLKIALSIEKPSPPYSHAIQPFQR